MSDDASKLQGKADLMSRVFLGRLPVRYEKMTAALALCRADPADEASWVELHRLLHALAEAAATFGRDGLAEQAGFMALLLEDMLKRDARSAPDVEEVARLLTILQSAS